MLAPVAVTVGPSEGGGQINGLVIFFSIRAINSHVFLVIHCRQSRAYEQATL